jgi:hypothetical protein
MLANILLGIIYYLLTGTLFAYAVADKINLIIHLMKETDETGKFKDMPENKLRKIVVRAFILLWPLFAYKFLKKSP